MRNNLFKWGNDLVAILKDKGDKAMVKFITSKRYKNGSIRTLPWNELKKIEPPGNPIPITQSQFDSQCSTCGTQDSIDGIECPGCGFKEWLQINEMAHLKIEPPMEIDGHDVSFIDMQFELYPGMTKSLLAKLLVHGFAARIPKSPLWLVYDRTTGTSITQSNEGKVKLPNNWWTMAKFD